MKILKSDYRIRAAQIEELPLLSPIERATAVLFLNTSYAMSLLNMDAEELALHW